MGLKFLQLFADMRDDHFEPLTDEELGVIIRASMDYAFDGTLPSFEPRSVLDLTWRRMKRHIDQCAGKVETLKKNGAKGAEVTNGRQKAATGGNGRQKAAKGGIKQDHDQEHEHDQEHKQEQKENAPVRGETAASADGVVFDLTGEDLSGDIERQHQADALIRRYNLPRDDVTREALLTDLQAHGEARMREVLTEASKSNSRDKVSVKFWRAILTGKGRDSPKGDYARRDYTASELNAIITTFD